MALIKFGSIIVDSRGKIGGHQLKLTRYGLVLQTKHVEIANFGAKRSVVRATFSTFSKRWWAALTETQRDDWRTLAAANPRPNTWGDLYPLTGQALYISINQILIQAGLSPTDDAPTDQTNTALTSATLTVTAPSTVSLAFTPTTAPTNHILTAMAAGPLSPGRTNASGKYLWLAASPSAQTSPWSLSSELLSLTGTIHTGRKYFLTVRTLNTANGARSPEILTDAIAT